MEDQVAVANGSRQALQIEYVAFDTLECIEVHCLVQKTTVSGGEVVVRRYLIATLQQRVDQVTANEPCAPRHKSPHVCSAQV